MQDIKIGAKVQTVITNEDGEPITVDGEVVNYQSHRMTKHGDTYAIKITDESYGKLDHWVDEKTVWRSVLDIQVQHE
jgi:hypothetical protein